MNGFVRVNRIVSEVTNDLQNFTEVNLMKKVLSLLIAVALVLSIGVTSVFAASDMRGANYTDADNDGVCDNCTNGGVCLQDGTGRRAGRGRTGQAAAFIDADGDGVCDNCTNGGVCPQNGTGAQRGRMGGRSK